MGERMYPVLKRFFDIVISLLVLALLSPVLLALSLWIKLDSPGPVLYLGPRVGKDRVMFNMYKFRTMVTNADKIGGSSTPDDDPRITRVGKFLRRYKLDELPQFLNVLKGEMSLVGPRPQVKWAVDLYTPEQAQVLTVPPGITDYASIHFPNEGEILKGSTDPDRDYMEKIHPKKMALSLDYLRDRSISVDFTVMLKTAVAMFR
jgi:lipopolysaccharide/colanic/teichoic acid biosynthesis glycosyltransferase